MCVCLCVCACMRVCMCVGGWVCMCVCVFTEVCFASFVLRFVMGCVLHLGDIKEYIIIIISRITLFLHTYQQAVKAAILSFCLAHISYITHYSHTHGMLHINDRNPLKAIKCTSLFEDLPLVEFMYLAFTCTSGELP